MAFELQLVLLRVSDVDRARAFYTEKAGFSLDADVSRGDDFRFVQCTPPGSACSVAFGVGLTEGDLGNPLEMYLVVADIEVARDELVGRGVEVSEIQHMTPRGWTPGADPQHADYNSFAFFRDPDGNRWVLQEVGHSRRERSAV